VFVLIIGPATYQVIQLHIKSSFPPVTFQVILCPSPVSSYPVPQSRIKLSCAQSPGHISSPSSSSHVLSHPVPHSPGRISSLPLTFPAKYL